MSFDADKSHALAAAAEVMMSPPIAVQSLHMPVQDGKPNGEAAHKKGDAAAGSALATLVIRKIGEQATSMRLYLKNICDLSQKGREAFRVALQENIRNQKAFLSAMDPDSLEYHTLKKAINSATVRLSEFVTFSRAVDMGFAIDAEETYYSAIAGAREFKNAQAADGIDAKGPTRRRGRPAAALTDKFKKFLVDNVNAENHKEAQEFFNTWMALQNFGKEAPAA